jgi:hypothetical protein
MVVPENVQDSMDKQPFKLLLKARIVSLRLALRGIDTYDDIAEQRTCLPAPQLRNLFAFEQGEAQNVRRSILSSIDSIEAANRVIADQTHRELRPIETRRG